MERASRTKVGNLVVVVAVALNLALAGCGSTALTNTWTHPAAKGAALSKVAVVSLIEDESQARMAETECARNMRGALAVPSHEALAGVDLKDREAVKNKLTAEGFQAVLILRLARGRDGRPPAQTFDRYYRYTGDSSVSGPGDTVVRVESKLYSLPDGQLLWSGESKTFAASTAEDVVRDVSRAVAKRLEKDGIVG
jgi:hypothetical protein